MLPIEKLASAYNRFQNAYGQSSDENYEFTIISLFSSDFKKIANGA